MDSIKFDAVWVIHCIEDEDRLKNIEYQKENNQWLKDNLQINLTCRFSHSDLFANSLLLSNSSRYVSNGSEVNLCREFYKIIKTSYLQGFNHICIFEDDFSLIKESIFMEYLKNIPEDFDIIQLSYLFEYCPHQIEDILLNENKFFIKLDFGCWSNCGLCLSKKGMKYFIDAIDKEFLAADIPIFESQNNNPYYGKTNTGKGLNHYIPNIPLIYLDGKDSRVQTENKEKLYKHYKLMDKKHYNIYNNSTN